jgi:hypothetical protein
MEKTFRHAATTPLKHGQKADLSQASSMKTQILHK